MGGRASGSSSAGQIPPGTGEIAVMFVVEIL